MTTPDEQQASNATRKHWLYREENLPKLWLILGVILVLALLPEFFLQHHPHVADSGFALDTRFGFFAWYGFLACAGMVAVAKILGIFLKRKDTYYDE
jgi:hypothetical protein